MFKLSKVRSWLVLVGLAIVVVLQPAIPNALAVDYQLSGTVKDSSGNGLDTVTVDIIDTVTSSIVATTTTDSFGNYTIVVSEGAYDIEVTPPVNSPFGSAVAYNRIISSNTTINFILASQGTAVLSGFIYGPLGNTIPGQTVSLLDQNGNTVASSTSDSNGYYSIEVSTGVYKTLEIRGIGNSPSLNVPHRYTLFVSNYTLN